MCFSKSGSSYRHLKLRSRGPEEKGHQLCGFSFTFGSSRARTSCFYVLLWGSLREEEQQNPPETAVRLTLVKDAYRRTFMTFCPRQTDIWVSIFSFYETEKGNFNYVFLQSKDGQQKETSFRLRLEEEEAISECCRKQFTQKERFHHFIYTPDMNI